MTTRCPICGAPLKVKESLCPECGAKVGSTEVGIKDTADLAKDRWSFTAQSPVLDQPKRVSPPPPKPEHQAQHPDAPTGAGYEGHRDVKHRYDATVEINAARGKPHKLNPQPTQVLHALRGPTVPAEEARVEKAERAPKIGATIIGVGLTDAEKGKMLAPAPAPAPSSSRGAARPPQATAPQEVKIELSPSRLRHAPTAEASHKSSAEQNRLPPQDHRAADARLTGRARLGAPETAPLSAGLGVAAALLLTSWFIPDVWSSPPLFSFQKMASMRGLELIALITRPICGAFLLAALLLPLKVTARAVLGLVAGLVALCLPLLLSEAPLPTRGSTVLLLTLACIGGSALCYARMQNHALGHILALLVPALLFAIALYGIAANELSPRQLSVFKEPLSILASAIISSEAAALLIRSRAN